MKIATWNVNSLKVRLPQVIQFLSESNLDILALQELKTDQVTFFQEELAHLGYHMAWYGQKTYNGVAFFSRLPIEDILYGLPQFEDAQKRVLSVSIGEMRLINLYCVNGESLESPKFVYKRKWFEKLKLYLVDVVREYEKVVVLGDFNIAPSDIDVHDPKIWRDKILCSQEERQWFQNILNLGFYDSVRVLAPKTEVYTWWNYRFNGFKRNMGLRIDHILVTKTLSSRLIHFEVGKALRSSERPSDHAPLVLEFDS